MSSRAGYMILPLRMRLLVADFLLLFSVIGTGCSPWNAYRAVPKEMKVREYHEQSVSLGEFQVEASRQQAEMRKNSCLEKYDGSKPFWLGHVEYTDYGTLQDHKQMDVIERALEADVRGNNSRYKNGLMLVVFVHGWQHNAREGDSNLAEFRRMLSKVSEEEGVLNNGKEGRRRGVLGVYVSWRGMSRSPWLLSHLTSYWGRKRVAHDIGHGNLVETLARLRNLQWMVARGGGRHEPDENLFARCRMISVGHSFGGAALFSAVSQPLEDRFQQQYWDKRRYGTGEGENRSPTMGHVSGMGDLVVLINPAFEALPYGSIHHMMSTNTSVSYHPDQSVLMMVLTARNDWANGMALPFGQVLGHRLRDLFPPDAGVRTEARRRRVSLGSYEQFHTHLLDKEPDSGHLVLKPNPYFFAYGPTKSEDGETLAGGAALPLRTLSKDYDLEAHCAASSPSVHAETLSGDIVKDLPEHLGTAEKSRRRLEAENLPKGACLLPYMVVSVDEQIINGHGGFWTGKNNDAYDFVSTLIHAQDTAVRSGRQKAASKESHAHQNY